MDKVRIGVIGLGNMGSGHARENVPNLKRGDLGAVCDIVPEKLLKAITDSRADNEILLALELRHRAYYPDEYQLEENLRASIDFWRRYVSE